METCVCDEGFLLSGTECVPKAQCGCSYNGAYIEAGASLFTDRCAEKCTCNKSTKKVDCMKPGCHQGYECKVVNDLIGCHPMEYAECSMTGGPHVETFDGHNYNFRGTCVYQLAGVCSKDPSLPKFEVDVQNDVYGKRVGSGAKLVEVKVDGNSIVVTRRQKGSVLVRSIIYNTGYYHIIIDYFFLLLFLDDSMSHVEVNTIFADKWRTYQLTLSTQKQDYSPADG